MIVPRVEEKSTAPGGVVMYVIQEEDNNLPIKGVRNNQLIMRAWI
jgi:hypothetical protein